MTASCTSSSTRVPRPHLNWSELRHSPLHDFPMRDEVLLQFLDWTPDLDVLEIGPGSGFTAYWLSRVVRHLTLLDVAEETIHDLKQQLAGIPNLDLIAADAASAGMRNLVERRFDAAFGLDVFDLIPDPVSTLKNLNQALRPGGQLLLSFPNVPPPRAKGVTCFRCVEELESILQSAGFARWEIFNIRPQHYAAFVYTILHEYPLRLFRKFRQVRQQDSRPQAYDLTWAFRNRGAMTRLRPIIHTYWAIVGWILTRGGAVFIRDMSRQSILNGQVVIRAWS